MKKLLLPILLGCGVLFPVTSVQAIEPPIPTYGDFIPGQTFTFTVTERFTARSKGIRVTEDVPVPDGIPDFNVGDAVTFTIGNKGQLRGPGFSIVYRSDKGRINTYANRSSASSPEGAAAAVSKSEKDKPVKAVLTFYSFKFSGFIPIATTVDYELEK